MKKRTGKVLALLLSAAIAVCGSNTLYAANQSTALKEEQTKVLNTKKQGELKLYQNGYLGSLPEMNTKLRGASSTQAVYNKILSSMKSMSSSVNLSSYKITEAQMVAITQNVVNDHPELYYVSGSYSYRLYQYGRKVYVYDAFWDYSVSKSTKAAMDKKLNSAVGKALSCLNSKMTQMDMALALHDYLISHVTYTEKTSYKGGAFTAYSTLVEGKGVCQGYSLAYNLLLSKKGIAHKFVPSRSMNHAWNLIYINKAWYHVDITWDDMDLPGIYLHDNFLISDAARKKYLLSGEKWDISTKSGKAYDNYFWRSTPFSFTYKDNYWYFSDLNGIYYKKASLTQNSLTREDRADTLTGISVNPVNKTYLFARGNTICRKDGNAITVLHTDKEKIISLEVEGNIINYCTYSGNTSNYRNINISKVKKHSFVWNSNTPVIQSVSSTGYRNLKISWLPAAGAWTDGYEIYRSENGKDYERIANRKGVVTSYSDTVPKTGTVYSYKICGYKQDGSAVKRSAYTSAKSGKALPNASKFTYGKADTYNKVTLKWSKSTGADGYRIYRATSAGGSYAFLKDTKALSYSNGGLDTGRTYYYKVRPYCVVNGVNVYGNYSSYKALKPVLKPIGKASVRKTGKTSAKVSWSKVSGAGGYEVYKSTSKSSGYKKIKTTKSTSYTYSKCTIKRRNYFRVRAYRTVKGKKVYTGYRTVSVGM